MDLTLTGNRRLTQFVGEPELDQRLPRHAKSPRLTVEGIHHPGGEIHVDPLRFGTNAPRLFEIEVFRDLLASIKFSIKRGRACFRPG